MQKKTSKKDPDLLYAIDDPFGLPAAEQIEMLWFECINRTFANVAERNACLFWLMEINDKKPSA